MEKIILKAELRSGKGKEISKKIRREGKIPGVLYSPREKENTLLKVKKEDLFKLISTKRHAMITLEINEENKRDEHLAIIKDIQYDNLKKQIKHIDFYGVTLKEKIEVEIGIELVGTPVGIKDGGVLELDLREVEIKCLPSQIPDALSLDISQLKINEHITAGQLPLPEGIELITDPERIVVSVHPPTKIEEVVKEKEEVEEAVTGEVEGEEAKKAEEESPRKKE